MIELVININNRKLINPAEFKNALKDLKDGKHLVTVKDYRKRSLSQNAYYWGVIVPLVKNGLYEAGFDEVKTTADAHEVMKHVLLRNRLVSKQTGDVIDIAGSSSKLTIPEFNNYIETICKWASEYLGVVIPTPGEELAMFIDQVEEFVEEAEYYELPT